MRMQKCWVAAAGEKPKHKELGVVQVEMCKSVCGFKSLYLSSVNDFPSLKVVHLWLFLRLKAFESKCVAKSEHFNPIILRSWIYEIPAVFTEVKLNILKHSPP